ncbi:hypothetical protein [Ruixingdingia sedimenti]|uniref:Uncharacterized protein n=1 Tax=Ruixingdingia sedimenti TaxID=3073604 RepID=A0ABU1FB82_9RHOB|nr:hypothetical protein [Xinfangfangia sp. LG-4]MDR5654131.1 hypothetical protein [Xinfangfangia sp. LG-4]
MRRLMLAAALMMAAATPAAADWIQLVPTNVRGADGAYHPALQMMRNGKAQRFLVETGEIPRAAVVDGPTAVRWVVDRFGLDPRRDQVIYCPGAILGFGCFGRDMPMELVVIWP